VEHFGYNFFYHDMKAITRFQRGFMRLKIILTFFIVLALASLASAQTKISGTAQCGKLDQENSIQIGDRANHSFSISQGKCTRSNA
jgi:hypothetical protein